MNKDSGVNTATSSQWVNKGASVQVTATYNSGYTANSGTGIYTMNAAKAVVVTSTYGYTLTWSSPLCIHGSYLGGVTSGTKYNAGSTIIQYTNTSGETAQANPYQSGSITIKPGTAVKLIMVSGQDGGMVSWIVGSSNINKQTGSNYAIISSSYTPTTSGTLSIGDGSHYSTRMHYDWRVKFS